jgi:hypothetical protein
MQFRAIAMARWILPVSGAADQHGVALLREEAAAGKIAHEGLVDRRALELEVAEVLSERQLGDGELVFDRACLLLADLGGEQIADDALGSCWRLTTLAMISSKATFMPWSWSSPIRSKGWDRSIRRFS